jgi:hypothetical protein
LGEGRGNAFIVFLKRGRKEIAVKAVNSRVVRELRRELYRKAKRDLRKPPDEDDLKAVFGGEAWPKGNKPNVRFDEAELEIEPLATTPALYSTELRKIWLRVRVFHWVEDVFLKEWFLKLVPQYYISNGNRWNKFCWLSNSQGVGLYLSQGFK